MVLSPMKRVFLLPNWDMYSSGGKIGMLGGGMKLLPIQLYWEEFVERKALAIGSSGQ